MKRGFIFDYTLCVNCKSCSASCILENGFSVKPRTVATFNSEVSVNLPVENISIACNHCEIPVCLNSCPVSAYERDTLSDAVLIDNEKCIGCRYCIWNCPFDAPKYNTENRTIGKCHLCYSRLKEDALPACVYGCPTGALNYDSIDKLENLNYPLLLPGEQLNPAIRFTGNYKNVPLRIVPASLFRVVMSTSQMRNNSIGSEWSLVLFSFLIMLSVSVISSSLINGITLTKPVFFSITLIPGIISFFHLGKKSGAWRAISNIRSSLLSREILLYLIYLAVSCFSVIYGIPFLIVGAILAGLFLLVIIDSVYIYSVRRPETYLHSGQTFITSLLITSFLSGSVLPFVFIGMIKLTLSVFTFLRNPGNDSRVAIRFVRIALLIVVSASYITGISYPGKSVVILLITGELIDRILFYIDFKPTGLNSFVNY
jgi:Fe-S-cluster-containing dehydrogenase component/DMSO reductase anchor subunit